MEWNQGRAEVEELIAGGELQRVPPSRRQAERLLDQARRHAASAASIADADPSGAYQLSYDAARKALVAVLENQGLRPTSVGGHIVVYRALRAQLVPPMGDTIRPFDRLRRRRRESEYPDLDDPNVSPDDVRDDLPKVDALIDLAGRLLDAMDPF